jgi:hypothetical protein
MSLTEISAVSALALPLYAHDIPSSEWYSFGEIGLAVPMGESGYHQTMNWSAPPNTRSAKSTTLSAIPTALEQIPEKSQLSITPSIPPPVQAPVLQATNSRVNRMVLYKLVVLGDEDVGKETLTTQVSFTALSGYMTAEFRFS